MDRWSFRFIKRFSAPGYPSSGQCLRQKTEQYQCGRLAAPEMSDKSARLMLRYIYTGTVPDMELHAEAMFLEANKVTYPGFPLLYQTNQNIPHSINWTHCGKPVSNTLPLIFRWIQ